ncbi:arylsulfatase [Pelagicoccus enzymogenes]|nr:arylsulfatase [Pelagicoccus enzymogenes]
MMNRINKKGTSWLRVSLLISLSLLGFSCSAQDQAEARRPNILIVLADDLGYSDLGCYGGEIETPVLDSLAAEGLRYSNFYNDGRCWPSRASLMTGYYAQQVAMDPVYGHDWPQWTRLLPHYLGARGYQNYLSGKWHLHHGPNQKEHSGFDRSYRLADHDRFFNPKGHFLDDVQLPAVDLSEGYYATVEIADRAISFLQEHSDYYPEDPFMLYLAFTAPHFPLHALPEDMARYDGKYDEGWDVLQERRHQRATKLGLTQGKAAVRRPEITASWSVSEERLRTELHPGEIGRAVAWDSLTAEQKRFQADKMEAHAAMVDRMDRELGRVLEQLELMGERDDTIVIFLSDNGATAEQMIRGDETAFGANPGTAESFLALGPGWSTAANSPLSLHKHWTHEGGIASPLIVNWPAGIRAAGEIRSEPTHIVDIVPTALDLADAFADDDWDGMAAPEFPGRSLVESFASEPDWEDRALFFSHSGSRGLRLGDWKAVMRRNNDQIWELYHIAEDRGETNDLAKARPELLDRLVAIWEAKHKEYKEDGLRGRDPDAEVVRIHKNW